MRVTLTEFNGHPLCDLRTFVEYRSTSEIGPTKKGVTFGVALLPQIIAGLQDAEAEARRRGLL
nr:transcriptional coactivator p15/PC4 family protein [Azospirillum sp. OGB3]